MIAVQVLLGATRSSAAQTHDATANVLGWPAGTWLVGIAGAVLVGIGLYQGYRALSRDFLEDAKVEQMSRGVKDAYAFVGVFGHLARMLVFALVGTFLIQSALDYDARKAIGLDGALAKVANQSFGHVALGVVAAGLIAFGLYSLADARYRRI